ncbi:Lysosomal thioesterase PPT2-A [Phytophthora citrophthora]|uniref:Lysosomal thioesterase PPT2-A n=1 Tax=Phytophthora citrophthora TaxID=4793 RepID=A0AAD9GM67_9STRA|nr:Lysosomal thioesterase PPT2-A [Phytophthora citrophthora]
MTGSASSNEKHNLPVFFFHGLTGNSTEGFNYQRNLTAEGRVFVPLAFCERECSLTALNIQVPMAIAAVREVVANDERFANGYIFIGHSQGAMMARAVIEQMDDHKVHTFVSLAGGVNGIFYGPQEADRNSIHDLDAGFGAAVLPQNLFDFTGYTPEGYRGKMQADFARRSMDPEIQAAYSITNLLRTPVRDIWLSTNQFLPMINNVNNCAWFDFHCHLEKIRRKNNFLKLKEAHYFASPEDGVVSPWQASHLGHYSELNSLEEIESKFETLTIVEMHDTLEYKEDTYGLRTLDERGALFHYTARGVPHCCWMYDFPKFHTEGMCKFHPLYDKYVYKVLW